MNSERIIIPRALRSQWKIFLLMAISALAVPFVSSGLENILPVTTEGAAQPSIRWADYSWLLWSVPIGLLLRAVYQVYNVRYSVDERAIEMRTGVLSWQLSITRVRFEDIRSIESRQTLTEQMLGIGNVEIGTAASSGMEISFIGIAQPREIQAVIQAEREARSKKLAA